MKESEIPEAYRRLREIVQPWRVPVVVDLARHGATPYEILIAALLSARTLDTTTLVVAPKLFAHANTPAKMIELDEKEIVQIIRPVTFPEPKARQILALSKILLEQYGGAVPNDLTKLDDLPGVGRKIANLVITQAFHTPGICVDVHVHRIVNRWGYVHTKTPDETELALRAKLPKRYWIETNELLVAFGQNLCRPASPKCSSCPIYEFCERVSVTSHR